MQELEKLYWMHGKYPHIRIPKALISQKCFSSLSCEAILLYGAMMDRTSLSTKYGGKRFRNQNNEVTIIYSQKEIMKLLRCKRDKARIVTRELVDSHLITVERPHRKGPYIITVIPYDWAHYPQEASTTMSKIPSIKADKNPTLDDDQTDTNNTDIINTDYSNTSFDCWTNSSINYSYLIELYGTEVIHKIQNTLLDIKEGDYIYKSNQREQETPSIDQLLSSLSTQHIEYVAKKIKKASYTTDHSQAFICRALWEAAILFDSKNKINAL